MSTWRGGGRSLNGNQTDYNYLVKLHGFKFGPDKSQSARVIKLASEIQVSVKHYIEGVGRFLVARSEANA